MASRLVQAAELGGIVLGVSLLIQGVRAARAKLWDRPIQRGWWIFPLTYSAIFSVGWFVLHSWRP